MKECKIVVGCRVRPLNKQELELGNGCVWRCGEDDASIHQVEAAAGEEEDGGGDAQQKQQRALGDKKLVSHSYDHVFDERHNNDAVYETLALPIIRGVLDGFHGTVFAYGQTSSGKTHTLLGVPEEMGIILHSVYDIFEHVFKAPPEQEYLIRVSYLEIYNEELRDLLGAPSKGNKNGKSTLRIVDDPKKGCEIRGLKEVVVLSPDHVLQLLKQGEEHRAYGATCMNQTSSRSHTVFRLVVESRVDMEAAETKSSSSPRRSSSVTSKEQASESQAVQTATLNLVDLAGSERVSKTGATGSLLKEGAAINKSLLVLGTVINKLAEGSKGHIPFRDSKLTRLLKNSLGGNARTAVVCALSPAARNLEESKSTLLFASRAKTIVNKAEKNHLNDKSALLDQYRSEIEELKLKLASGGVSVTDAPGLDTVRQQLEAEAARRAELEEKYEQAHLDTEQKKVELKAMHELTMLTSKVAANPYLAGQVQTMMARLTSGERSVQEVTDEVQALHKRAEEEEELAFQEGDADSKVVSFSQLGRILGVKKTAPGQKRHISTLAQGIVASLSQARQSEQAAEAGELVAQHQKDKVAALEAKVAALHGAEQRAEALAGQVEALTTERAAQQAQQAEEAKADESKAAASLQRVQCAEQRAEALAAQVEALTAERAGQQANESKAAVALQAAEQRAAALASQVEALNAERTGQQANESKTAAALQAAEQRAAALASQVEALTAERAGQLAAAKAHEAELGALLERLERQRAVSDEQKASNAAQLAQLTETAAAYEAKILALEEGERLAQALALDKQALEAAVADKDRESEALQQRLARQGGELEQARQALQPLQDEVARLDAELQGRARAESAAAATAAASAAAAAHREQREDSLLDEVESLKLQLGAAEASLASSTRRSAAASPGWEVESMRCALEEAQEACRALELEAQTARKRLAEGAAQHERLSKDHDLQLKEAERTRAQLADKELELAAAMAGLQELNVFVEEQLAQYQRALKDERRAAQDSGREAKAAKERCEDMEHELRVVQADAARATETFVRYRKTAEARELHLTNLLSVQHNQQQQQQQPSLHSRMSVIQQQLSTSSTTTSSATSQGQHRQSASSGEIQRLKAQLSSAKEELDVFRRLDIYSVSLKRGMTQVGRASRTSAPAAPPDAFLPKGR